MAHVVIDARLMFSKSGTARYLERLIYYLERMDTKNKYTILLPTNDLELYKPVNPNFSKAAADFNAFSFAEQIGFLKLLNNLGADLVHFAMPQQPVLYTGKSVTTFHDLSLLKTYNTDKNWFVYHLKQFVGRWALKKIARNSNYIIVPTITSKKDLLDFVHYPEKNVVVTYEGTDIRDIKAKPVQLPFSRFIMYQGRQSTYKNIRALGDAHQKLLLKYPDLGLVLVGRKDPASESNVKYFTEKGYKNILFTGFLSDEESAWLYQHTEAYVFPSFLEGFGLPALEAMGQGAPIVSSNTTCLPEVYGDAALYFDPTNIDEMVEKISQVIEDRTLRNNLIKKGYKQVQKYSWEKMAKETLAVYNKALKD